MASPTIKTQIESYISTLGRSANTKKTYRQALKKFTKIVGATSPLSVETYKRFLLGIQNLNPSSRSLYITSVMKLYEFHKTTHLAELKLLTTHYINKNEGKHRLLKFDRQAIEIVIAYCQKLRGDLIALRDRAFVLTLADTGLRIHEAIKLNRGDIDWQAGRTVIIGKRDKEAVVRFSKRSLSALKDYLGERDRNKKNSSSQTPLAKEPLFAAHDISASKKVRRATISGMQKAIKGTSDGKIKGRFEEAGIDRTRIRIHDFRHYFVTVAYEKLGLKKASEMSRHENMNTTNRYTHLVDKELDRDYDSVFNQ